MRMNTACDGQAAWPIHITEHVSNCTEEKRIFHTVHIFQYFLERHISIFYSKPGLTEMWCNTVPFVCVFTSWKPYNEMKELMCFTDNKHDKLCIGIYCPLSLKVSRNWKLDRINRGHFLLFKFLWSASIAWGMKWDILSILSITKTHCVNVIIPLCEKGTIYKTIYVSTVLKLQAISLLLLLLTWCFKILLFQTYFKLHIQDSLLDTFAYVGS